MIIHIFTDGGSRGNPGPAASGIYVVSEDGKELAKFGIQLGITTNNVAEYTAVIEAMQWLLLHQQHITAIQFFMDSKLVCNQMNGVFQVKHPNMIPLFAKAKQLEQQLGIPVTYSHIPREKNKEADRMVNQALDNLL
ncbi:MAG TPA: ribonuclease HI family protein [Patescibacteria group bacterium]|nr:ribonuclease HI family protein [Patescibacteria group bacterium]